MNGYTYLSPMHITDGQLIQQRLQQFLAKIDELSRNIDTDLARYHEEQDREQAFWQKADLSTPNLMSLLEYWRRALVTMDRFWKLHFLIVFPRHVVAGMLGHAVEEHGIKNPSDVGKLTQSHGMTRQMELDMALWALAGSAIKSGLKGTFLDTFEEDLEAELKTTDKGRAWLQELNVFLLKFGARNVLPLELFDRSWQEDPKPVLGTIRGYIAQGGKYDFDRVHRERASEREQMIASLLAGIKDAAVRDRLRGTLEAARKFQQAMEDDNYYFLWSGVQVRKVALEIGKRLHAAGILDSPDDVFFLRREQMEQALVDLASGMYEMASYRELARSQKAAWERWCQLQPPPYLGNLPDEISDFTLTQFWGIRGRKQLDEREGSVGGLGASPGIAEGIARHVYGPQEFAKLQPGEILVCRSTNPAWTPVFSRIAAIVTDQGGTLSHAAVVAREYGIPAVLGTIHATKRIPNGARIRVDGGAGKVEIL